MTTDYTTLPTPELNKLIHDLSVESRNRYETKQALLACGVKRAKPTEVQRELEKVRGNIDAKASRSDSEAIPDGK